MQPFDEFINTMKFTFVLGHKPKQRNIKHAISICQHWHLSLAQNWNRIMIIMQEKNKGMLRLNYISASFINPKVDGDDVIIFLDTRIGQLINVTHKTIKQVGLWGWLQ